VKFVIRDEEGVDLRSFISVLFACFVSMPVLSETKNFPISDSAFISAAKFESVGAPGTRNWAGALIGLQGQAYPLPDVCEHGGGDPEVTYAYVIHDAKEYFVFVCRWRVEHRGINYVGLSYSGFVYELNNNEGMKKHQPATSVVSGYEGSLEGGGRSYHWYEKKQFAAKKIKEVLAGASEDSLELAVDIILSRLKDHDREAVVEYLNDERIENLITSQPINHGNVPSYNNLGFALVEAGGVKSGYLLLKKVEKITPDRLVLKLNIADALWLLDRSKSIPYYQAYALRMRQADKGDRIPPRVLERFSGEPKSAGETGK
jgi:hypothetical protein